LNLYFIQNGALRVFYFKEEREITEYFEFEGAFVARAESLLKGITSNKGITSIEASTLWLIPTLKFFALFEQNHGIEKAYHRLIEEQYITLINRLERLQFLAPASRYQLLLNEYPQAIQRIPLKYLASFLGISQVSLSRIRSRLA
jgi:CRP-like cAMP-binding protein